MRSLLKPFLLIFALLAVSPATAADLGDLLASGAVGERYDGFAEARDPSAAATVKAVNEKRLAIYEKRAKETGQTVDVVGRIYASEIWDAADPGTWFHLEDGSWVQK